MARSSTSGVPSTPEGLAELLADPQAAERVLGGGGWDKFHGAYAAAAGAADPSIAQRVKEEAQIAVRQMLKGAGAHTPIDFATVSGSRSAVHNKRAVGARYDGLFNDFGDFVAATWHRGSPDAATAGKLLELKNAFGTTVPSDGGFLIPEAFRSDLLALALERSIVRPRARVIPMGSLTTSIPTVDSTSNASSVHGGMIGAWTEESAQLDDTSPKFGRIKLEAKKLTAYSEVPNELFADAPALGAFVEVAFPETLAWFEDVAFLTGSGVGEPLGMLNAAAAVEVAKESGQAADTILWENIIKMFARMLPGSLNRAVWIANNDTFPQLATMSVKIKNVAGTENVGGGAVWINNGAEGPPMTILGRPVIFTEKVPTLGDAGDISFVDLGSYLIGDRQVAELRTSEHFKFRNDETAVRIVSRVDGRPWIQSAITPNQGASTLSPVVKIAARA